MQRPPVGVSVLRTGARDLLGCEAFPACGTHGLVGRERLSTVHISGLESARSRCGRETEQLSGRGHRRPRRRGETGTDS